MKKLEDMNLANDFLAYSLTAHKTYGEEASRYILECILQRRIVKTYEVEKRIRKEGMAEAILELLEEIGVISEELEKRIRRQKDLETLRKWLKLAAHSKNIAEFEGQISEDTTFFS